MHPPDEHTSRTTVPRDKAVYVLFQGDSQKSLFKSEYSELLFDSASDLVHFTGGAEVILDLKRRHTDVGSIEEACLISSPSSIDSDGVMRPFLDDRDRRVRRCRSYGGMESPSKSDDVFLCEFPRPLLLNISGTLSSGVSGRDRATASSSGHVRVSTEIEQETEMPLTSPSHQTTAGSSVQTSTLSHVDGHGFIISGDSYERLPPFIHYDPPRGERINRRSQKWRSMLVDAEDNWEEICRVHSHLLKKRVRKGIPQDWRYRAWSLLSGGRMLQRSNPNVYKRLVRSMCEYEEKILRDITRTLPRHILFVDPDGPGQRGLFNILKAYSVYDPEVGYVQGTGSLVAPLLLVMSEEDAFWTFAALMREEAPFPRPTTAGPHVGCRRLYQEGLPLTHELMSKLDHLIRERMPQLYARLRHQDINSRLFTTKWWMTLFCFVLPFQHMLRVWDIFFLEGWKMGLRTGLAIMKCIESQLMDQSGDPFSILDAFNIARSLPPPDAFIKLALSMRITKSLESWHRSIDET